MMFWSVGGPTSNFINHLIFQHLVITSTISLSTASYIYFGAVAAAAVTTMAADFHFRHYLCY